jgi:hypothetical protein
VFFCCLTFLWFQKLSKLEKARVQHAAASSRSQSDKKNNTTLRPEVPRRVREFEGQLVRALVRLGGERGEDLYKGVFGWTFMFRDLWRQSEMVEVQVTFAETQITSFLKSLVHYYENCLTADAIIEHLAIRTRKFTAMQACKAKGRNGAQRANVDTRGSDSNHRGITARR